MDCCLIWWRVFVDLCFEVCLLCLLIGGIACCVGFIVGG